MRLLKLLCSVLIASNLHFTRSPHLTSLIFAFIVEPYFLRGNLSRGSKKWTKSGNFLHYRTCPSMRQTRPWETITFYIGAEKGVEWGEIIPSELKTKAPPPTQLMLLGRKGSSVAFSVLGPLGSFTRLKIPLFLTLSEGSTIFA